MDDYVKAHQSVPLFDKEWHRKQESLRKKQRAKDPAMIKGLLLALIPKGGKHDRVRILIKEVCNHNLSCKNFYIARRIWKDNKHFKNVKLSVETYQKSDKNYSQRIKNLHKTVRTLIKRAGFTVTFNKERDTTEIMRLK